MDYEDQDDLMPEIIEATQQAITSEEEETDEDNNIIDEPKSDLKVNEMFEEKKEEEIIEEKPKPLKVCRVKKETEKSEEEEEEERPKTENKKTKGSIDEKTEKRKNQLEQLRMMRERKKILAEERAKKNFLEKSSDKNDEVEIEPKTPKPRTPPRTKTPEKTKVSFDPDELNDFMENIAIKSIERYKAEKKKKEQKIIEPPKIPLQNPINNLISREWTEESLYAGFFN